LGRGVGNGFRGIANGCGYMQDGFSVRCLRDS
jgi:hypothetical protein